MPLWFVQRLKNEKIVSKSVLYMWDSFRNKGGAIAYLNYFDKVYSFDRTDCEQINKVNFLPLFFLEEYSVLSNVKSYKYDCCFIGTAHSDRYALIKKMQKHFEQDGVICYWYMYLQSRKMFIWQKLTNPYFKSAKMSEFEMKIYN